MWMHPPDDQDNNHNDAVPFHHVSPRKRWWFRDAVHWRFYNIIFLHLGNVYPVSYEDDNNYQTVVTKHLYHYSSLGKHRMLQWTIPGNIGPIAS